MKIIIALYAFGIALGWGCWNGAEHHAVTAAACIIFATRLLQERIEERRAKS